MDSPGGYIMKRIIQIMEHNGQIFGVDNDGNLYIAIFSPECMHSHGNVSGKWRLLLMEIEEESKP